jgi:hypothetical protein
MDQDSRTADWLNEDRKIERMRILPFKKRRTDHSIQQPMETSQLLVF